MNLSQEAGDSTSELLFANFNQDTTSLSVGTKLGYKLFPLTTLEMKLNPSFEKEGGEVCIIERLFSSSLVAVVELAHPRKLRACHFKKNSEICTYSYPDIILAVKLNRQRLVVVLKQNLYIHNIRDMKVMHTIRDTPKNPAGLCALSVDNDGGYLAYPGNSQNGEVQVFDAINLKAVAAIHAHESPLAAIAFNNCGSRLASASTTGTVIRVFGIPSGDKLFEFRRGMKRFIQINCLAFSNEDTFLATTSSTETVHIFKLTRPTQERAPEEQQGWMSYIGKAIGSTASYLGSDALSMNRAFAHMKLPKPGVRSVCAVTV
jgi:autophagy-related protein 18